MKDNQTPKFSIYPQVDKLELDQLSKDQLFEIAQHLMPPFRRMNRWLAVALPGVFLVFGFGQLFWLMFTSSDQAVRSVVQASSCFAMAFSIIFIWLWIEGAMLQRQIQAIVQILKQQNT